ncbi:MAG TPA: hypothetical protein VIJ51_10045 [Solirubrobacteraceae bacterium]
MLALIALAVVLSVATDLGWWRGPVHAISRVVLGGAALVIVASQLIDRPPSALHSEIGTGGWLALVGAGAIVVGALIAESRVTVSFNAAAPPAGPARPAAGWTGPRRRSRPPHDAPIAGSPGPGPAAGSPGSPGPGPGPLAGTAGPTADHVVPPVGDRVVAETDLDDETVVAPVPPRRPRP